MTKGHKSSERRACYHAFYVGCAIAMYGLYTKASLEGLALLIPAVASPLMWYAGNRSYVKGKIGEDKE